MFGLIQGCGQRAVEDIWKVSLHLNFVLMNNHILLCLCSSVDLSRVLEMITGERRLLACLRINEDACAALMKLEGNLGDKDRKEDRRSHYGGYCVSYNEVFGFSFSL